MSAAFKDQGELIRKSAATAYSRLITAWPGVLTLADHLFHNLRASGPRIHSFFRTNIS